MTRYVSWVGDDVLETSHELNDTANLQRTLQVHEPDTAPVDTGLLDHHGNKVHRVTVKPRIGF